jgi:hypothetical protein
MILLTQTAQAVITGTITTPFANAFLPGSSSHDIVWTVAGGEGTHTAELWLSTDGGASYPEFICSLTHSNTGGTWTWSVPATNTANAMIMIIGTDSAVTQATFSITSWTFTIDSILPSAPDACTATVSASNTTLLVNNNWQNKTATPYFEWSGSTDSGSGIAGYSVYWGTSTAGDPGTGAVTQTAATYTAVPDMVDGKTYCLRVRARDNAGNWSEVVTLFGCGYDVSIAAPTSLKADGFNPSTWSTTGTFSIDWINPTDASGIKGIWCKYGGLSDAPTSPTDGTFITSKPFVIPEIPGGITVLYAWLEDNAGNRDYAECTKQLNLRCDFDGPPGTPTNLTADEKPQNSDWKQTPNFSINWDNITDSCGIKGAWYLLGITTTFTTAHPFTATVTNEGSTQITVWLEDNSGKKGTQNTNNIILRYDASQPNNPATCTGWANSAKETAVPINLWQNIDASPYLEWATATDKPPGNIEINHSGVDCYSVYWGTSYEGIPNMVATQTTLGYIVPVTQPVPTNTQQF